MVFYALHHQALQHPEYERYISLSGYDMIGSGDITLMKMMCKLIK
jgi:hypothetical protein